MNNKRIALMILAISTLGFAATYQIADLNFLMGMINNGFGAAMVGGLADWFAITALFQEIPGDRHSDILRKKRADLTDAIVNFSTKDLLNIGNIKQEIEKMFFSKLIVRYLKECQGIDKFRRTVRTAVECIIEKMDLCAVFKKIEKDIRRCLEEGAIENLFPKLGKKIVESRHTADFFKTLLFIAKDIYNQPEFQELLLEHIRQLGGRYDKKGFGRETVRGLAFNDEDILKSLNAFVNKKLEGLSDNADEVYDKIKDYAKSFLASEQFLETLVYKKEDLLNNDELIEWLYGKIDAYQKENHAEILQMVDKLTIWGINEFIVNKEWQKRLDEFLKEQAGYIVEENHGSLGEMIRNKLANQTDDEIVAMVQGAAGDDIHAIRISGSLVGGAAGMALYALGTGLEMLLR